jgi:hypothetical protein
MQMVTAALSVWLLLIASANAWDNEPSGGEISGAGPSPSPATTPAPTAAPSGVFSVRPAKLKLTAEVEAACCRVLKAHYTELAFKYCS